MTNQNNRVSQMMRQQRNSESQNTQKLHNLAGQVPDPALRQQASQQLGQMSSKLNQSQSGQSGMGMTTMNSLGNTTSMNMGSQHAGNLSAGLTSSTGMSGLNSNLGGGMTQTMNTVGMGQMSSANTQQRQKQSTSFGVGHLINKR